MRTERSGWRLLVALAVMALALFAAACGDDDVEEFSADTTMGKIQEAGEITLGVKYDVPPFGFNNPESGEVEGFDVDLGKRIAEELGVEPEFVEAISDNRIPFLQ